jgi:hypothetical protein
LSGVTCTDDRIAAYLQTGVLPKRLPGNHSDVQCPPVPAPQPDAALAPAAKAGSAAGTFRAELRSTVGPSVRSSTPRAAG